MQTTYDEMISNIWEDSTFCDYWKRIPRGVDFESLELYFVDFIIEHYENNEVFIQLMNKMNPDGSTPYSKNYNYEGIIAVALAMLWGFTMIRGYPPHFWKLVRHCYSRWQGPTYNEKLWEFHRSVEKKVWETYFSRNHYVLK